MSVYFNYSDGLGHIHFPEDSLEKNGTRITSQFSEQLTDPKSSMSLQTQCMVFNRCSLKTYSTKLVHRTPQKSQTWLECSFTDFLTHIFLQKKHVNNMIKPKCIHLLKGVKKV